MAKKIFFIGPLGAEASMVSGDSLKNLHLTRQLEKLSVHLDIIDTNACRKSVWKTLSALCSVITHRKSKYIVSASTRGAYIILQLLRFFKIKDIIYWVIGGDVPHMMDCGFINKRPYKNAKTIIVEGERMKESLNISGLDNVMMLPNFKHITSVPKKQQRSAEAPVKFVFLSRITEDKGCSHINKATEILNSRGLAHLFTVDFYGSIADEYKEKFHQEISQIPNISYKGFLNLLQTENYATLSQYDAMLFPTFFYGEGFAGIFIDAFIAGLPVIATDWSLNGEIIHHGKTGWIVPNRNIEALADAMEQVIRNPQQAWEMGQACQAQCMKYDTDHVVTPSLLKQLNLLNEDNK
jgi:glycosyltransferase involved in cell wall biosynthesis